MPPAGNVQITLALNSASYTKAMADVKKSLNGFSDSAKGAGKNTVGSMQSAAASIRLLDDPLNANIRTLSRFVSQSKIAGQIFQAAFPVVGAVAAVAMVAKLGSEITAFITKAKEMPKAIEQGFSSLHLAALSSTDALRLTNDELRNSIAKLNGAPQNNLAIQIDEARIKADELAKSLENDMTKAKALLEQNKLGIFEATLTGQGRTGNTAGSVSSFLEQLAHLGSVNNANVHRYGADNAQSRGSAAEIQAKQDAFGNWLDRRLAVINNPNLAKGDELEAIGGFGDQSSNRAIVEGAQDILRDSRDNQTQQDAHSTLVPQEKAAQQAADARKKQAEQFRQMLETDLELVKTWQKYAEEIAKDTQEWSLNFFKTNGLSSEATSALTEQGHGANAYIQSLRQSIDLNKQNSTALSESAIQMAVATGQMTKLDAAQAMAAIHAQDYNDALQKLKDQQTMIQLSPEYNSNELARKAALQDNQNQTNTLSVSYQMQTARDSQASNPAGSSAVVGFADALNQFVIASRDAAHQMEELTTNTLQGLNQQIVAAMSGQKTNFAGFGAGVFRNVASMGLTKAEGTLIGTNKLGSAQGNPMWVRLADGGSAAATGLSGIISRMMGGGAKGPGQSGLSAAIGQAGEAYSNDQSNGGIGTIASVLTGMIPFLASGGPIDGPAIVGEQGPELFVPSSPGTIVPNHKLSSRSNGNISNTVHVDARGANDPAQTEAAVHRAMGQWAPQIMAGSMHAMEEKRKRSPSSAR
jgi:Lambda phage tail tape-measure protein (Tape_meas_lam_C)